MAETLAEYRRLTEERFRQLADNIHEIVWLTDIQQAKVFYISLVRRRLGQNLWEPK
jgi:hypothetical protein